MLWCTHRKIEALTSVRWLVRDKKVNEAADNVHYRRFSLFYAGNTYVRPSIASLAAPGEKHSST